MFGARPASRPRSPTTSSTTFYATATDAAGNRRPAPRASSTSRTRRPPPPRAASTSSSPPRRRTTTPRRSPAPPRPARRSRSTPTRTCTGAVDAPAARPPSRRPGSRSRVANDTTTSFYAHRDRRRRQRLRAAPSAITYVEDSTAPGRTRRASPPRRPRRPTTTRPGHRHGRGRLDGQALHQRRLHRSRRGDRQRRRVRVARPHGHRERRRDHDLLRHRDRRRRQHLGLLELRFTYVEDSTAPAAPSALVGHPSSPANDNAPVVKRHRRGRLDGQALRDADCTGTPLATGSAAAFAAPGLTVSVADDTTTTFYATATDAAGNTGAARPALTYVEDSSSPTPAGLDDDAPRRRPTPTHRGLRHRGERLHRPPLHRSRLLGHAARHRLGGDVRVARHRDRGRR